MFPNADTGIPQKVYTHGGENLYDSSGNKTRSGKNPSRRLNAAPLEGAIDRSYILRKCPFEKNIYISSWWYCVCVRAHETLGCFPLGDDPSSDAWNEKTSRTSPGSMTRFSQENLKLEVFCAEKPSGIQVFWARFERLPFSENVEHFAVGA